MVSEVETNAVAIERVKEYTEKPQEAPWEIEYKPPAVNSTKSLLMLGLKGF